VLVVAARCFAWCRFKCLDNNVFIAWHWTLLVLPRYGTVVAVEVFGQRPGGI
jgi:hypothetical protein